MNLSHHRLQDDDSLERIMERMGCESFVTYQLKIIAMLKAMAPGARFPILKYVDPANYELFIKVVCKYIVWRGDMEFVFNDQFNVIIRQYEKERPAPLERFPGILCKR
ncbi:MAG: hypothetical protein ACRDDZ_05940 [Marinifilaceae bacterium]